MGNNALNLYQIWLWLKEYIFFGMVPPIIFGILAIMYFVGKSRHMAIQTADAEKKFTYKKYEFSPAYGVFKNTNRLLDFLLGSTLTIIYKKFWIPITDFVSSYVSDEQVEKLLTKLGVDFSFKHRVDLAQQHFEENNNAFWWNKLRAPDFRRMSPIISGKWFNGKPVEDYLPLFIHPKSTYKAIKTSLVVFVISFAFFALIYKPQVYVGWLAGSTKTAIAKDVAEKMIATPAIVPEFRKDFWSAEEQAAVNSQVQEMAEPFATRFVNNATGYNYYWFGFLFKNGLLTDLFISLAIAAFFIRKTYYKNLKGLHIPYIKDSHELAGYEKKISQIETLKRTLSAANLRATGFDRQSPLIATYISTGGFEKKGVIGAYPKNHPIYQSLGDKSQNTAVFGGTGAGKSQTHVIPEVGAWFEIKNMYYNQQKAYTEIFDTRINQLTPKAIELGYLEEYRPLPDNPISVSLAMADIKAQLWKDMAKYVEESFLATDFIKIGANEDEGQYSVDLLANVYDSAKLKDILNSLMSQLGATDSKDFWDDSAKRWIQRLSDLAICFQRTLNGYQYMTKKMMKIWSLMFIYNLVCLDSKNHLLAHCVYSIYEEAETNPERLADVLTEERVQSIQSLMTEWVDLGKAAETKIGMKANMDRIMSDYNNSKLRPFFTGVGNNVIEVKEFWNKICAFDFPMDIYSTAGKSVLLMIKTLIFEEAVNRQTRFSRRVVEISNHFKRNFPELMLTESSVEAIDITWFANKQSLELLNDYHDYCDRIQNQIKEDWERGTYQTKLNGILAKFPEEPSIKEYHEPMTAEALTWAKKALNIASEIRALEPRFATIEKDLQLAIVDGSMFNAHKDDSAEVRAAKRKNMALYYEYKDALTRIKREHMLFLGDEYQELITLDKSGGCMSDFNFWNISRSTNTKGCLLTQTVNAYELKIGKEASANFLNQMRSHIYLSTEDQTTREYVVKLAGTADIFESPLLNQKLKDNGTETDNIIYDNFNAYISDCVETNKYRAENNQQLLKEYPYTENIFSKAESIEVTDRMDFSKIFSSIWNKEETFEIPSMKRHFLDEKSIKEAKEEGSDATGKRNNSEQIHDAWSRAQDEMENKYQSYLSNGFKKDAQILTDSEFTGQGNIHAYVTIQRAGMLVKEHVIIAPEFYYQVKN